MNRTELRKMVKEEVDAILNEGRYEAKEIMDVVSDHGPSDEYPMKLQIVSANGAKSKWLNVDQRMATKLVDLFLKHKK